MTQQILTGGEWTCSTGTQTFQAVNPATEEALPGEFPISPWSEIDAVLQVAADTASQMRGWPGSRFAAFLNAYADEIEKRSEDLVAAAHAETALPISPRLKDAELPRTTNQLRQAAAAALTDAWRNPVIDTAAGIRSMLAPIGPVVVFGPNNFPFAFNGIAGGDFAAAIAAGNPVIAKGHSCHPETTRIFAEAALAAIRSTDMPPGLVQLIYRTSHEDGYRLVSDPRIGAVGYTGARHTGLKLKAAADAAGKPIYLELSSINPVFILPGALRERLDAIADEFSGSCLMGTGQFCTNPGIAVVIDGPDGRAFIDAAKAAISQVGPQTMLTDGIAAAYRKGRDRVAGSSGVQELVTSTCDLRNATPYLFETTGETWLANHDLGEEVFGPLGLVVTVQDADEMREIARSLQGQLTCTIHMDDDDTELGRSLMPILERKAGRVLANGFPTGVEVADAMVHGGPYPASTNFGHTSVGTLSIRRFLRPVCYQNMPDELLPADLRD